MEEKKEKKKKLGWFFLKMFLLTLLVIGIGEFSSSFLAEGLKYLISSAKYGGLFIVEIISAFIILIIMLISKNSYVFKEKRNNIFKSILKAWPLLVVGIFHLVLNIIDISKLNEISISNLISLLLYAISIGLYEEFLCRGWIQNEFMERFGKTYKGVILSILLSSIVFGIIHLQNIFAGQDVIITILQVLSATSFGILAGSIYYRTKNIWSVVLIHAFWDFSLMLGEVNLLRDCGTEGIMPKNVFIISSVFIILIILLNLVAARLVLNKRKIEESLIESEQNIETYDNRKEKRNTIFNVIFIFILFAGILTANIVEKKIDDKGFSKCYEYNKKEFSEVETHYFIYKTFSIDYHKDIINIDNSTKTENYNFIIYMNKDSKLVIQNKNTNEKITLDYKDVIDYIVYENENEYVILITQYEAEGTKAYMSNFIKKDNLSNEKSYLDEIEKSFEEYDFPYIEKIGYINEKNSNKKYPLLKSDINDGFVIYSDKKPYVIKIN